MSSAIAANLALENDLITSCRIAKKYVEQFLASDKSLLGAHYGVLRTLSTTNE